MRRTREYASTLSVAQFNRSGLRCGHIRRVTHLDFVVLFPSLLPF
jgi:hypothetical protein